MKGVFNVCKCGQLEAGEELNGMNHSVLFHHKHQIQTFSVGEENKLI